MATIKFLTSAIFPSLNLNVTIGQIIEVEAKVAKTLVDKKLAILIPTPKPTTIKEKILPSKKTSVKKVD